MNFTSNKTKPKSKYRLCYLFTLFFMFGCGIQLSLSGSELSGKETARQKENAIPEASLKAKEIKAGAIALNWKAPKDCVLSGAYLRLANCVPPRINPVIAFIRIDGKELATRITLPAFPCPIMPWTMPHTNNTQCYPPLDVAREFRQGFAPVPVKKGAVVEMVIESAEAMKSGIVAGLQLQGKYELAKMRNPIRDCRTNGPVCRIPWSDSEVIAVGTHERFDPLCAPQNNSSIIGDEDGTLYQFTAYYSVDEQYGGGRAGSYSRIYGYTKKPGAKKWEELGLIVDLLENMTYSGDPFVFRDLDGVPCMVFTTCDGTNGFADWKYIDAFIIRSKTKSFAGPWNKPTALFEHYPGSPDDNKTGGRANCLRIYNRPKTKDYVVAWNHGTRDMNIRVLVTPSLDKLITHDQINNGTVVSVNQEEGGGGFQWGDKGYYSTWQIPCINDPTGVQRMYEIDLADALNPEAWRVVPGSIGFNNGFTKMQNGGCTADAWAISIVNDTLWATSCEYSTTNKKNYLLARSCPIKNISATKSEELFPKENRLRYGAVHNGRFYEVAPVIEYAIGSEATLEFDFCSQGDLSYGFIGIAPSDSPIFDNAIEFEISPNGCRLVHNVNDKNSKTLNNNPNIKWEPGKTYRLKMTRQNNKITAYVNGNVVCSTEIKDPEILKVLNRSPRFKLYGWQGGAYSISNAILIDGPVSQ